MLGIGLSSGLVLSASACLYPLGTSYHAREHHMRPGERTYLPQLSVVNQLRPVSVDQGAEAKTILPTVKEEKERGGHIR